MTKYVSPLARRFLKKRVGGRTCRVSLRRGCKTWTGESSHRQDSMKQETSVAILGIPRILCVGRMSKVLRAGHTLALRSEACDNSKTCASICPQELEVCTVLLATLYPYISHVILHGHVAKYLVVWKQGAIFDGVSKPLSVVRFISWYEGTG